MCRNYMQVCPKDTFFFAYKTLVLLIIIKTGQNRRFHLWKCAVSGCGVSGSILGKFWVCLCTFMKVYMAFEQFFFRHCQYFWLFLDHFGPVLPTKKGHFGTKMGLLGDLEKSRGAEKQAKNRWFLQKALTLTLTLMLASHCSGVSDVKFEF